MRHHRRPKQARIAAPRLQPAYMSTAGRLCVCKSWRQRLVEPLHYANTHFTPHKLHDDRRILALGPRQPCADGVDEVQSGPVEGVRICCRRSHSSACGSVCRPPVAWVATLATLAMLAPPTLQEDGTTLPHADEWLRLQHIPAQGASFSSGCDADSLLSSASALLAGPAASALLAAHICETCRRSVPTGRLCMQAAPELATSDSCDLVSPVIESPRACCCQATLQDTLLTFDTRHEPNWRLAPGTPDEEALWKKAQRVPLQ